MEREIWRILCSDKFSLRRALRPRKCDCLKYRISVGPGSVPGPTEAQNISQLRSKLTLDLESHRGRQRGEGRGSKPQHIEQCRHCVPSRQEVRQCACAGSRPAAAVLSFIVLNALRVSSTGEEEAERGEGPRGRECRRRSEGMPTTTETAERATRGAASPYRRRLPKGATPAKSRRLLRRRSAAAATTQWPPPPPRPSSVKPIIYIIIYI